MTTILIAEDNPTHMHLAKTVLELHGYIVLQAADADSALLQTRTHLPDLVLMGMQLGESNGLDVVRELKQDPATRAIPMIAMTSYLSEHPHQQALGVGCVGYIAKQYHYKELLGLVQEVLGGEGA